MRQNLILVPTTQEISVLISECPELSSETICACGLGCVLSAVTAGQLIIRSTVKHVFLIGIAGRYDQSLELGNAYIFDQVSLYGVGVGSGDEFQLPSEFGFGSLLQRDQIEIGETIELNVAPTPESSHPSHHLLTVAAAADSATEVQQRLAKFPAATAEDMEAFGIAAACRLAGIELTVIRGISNDAGDRNHAHWKINESLRSAGKIFLSQKTNRAFNS